MQRTKIGWLCVMTVCLLCAADAMGQAYIERRMPLHFVCGLENGLYRVLNNMGEDFPRFDTAEDAVAAAPFGGAVLILADNYPEGLTRLSSTTLTMARQKKQLLYVECPESMSGITVGTPRFREKERAVVCSDFFGEALPSMSILSLGHFSYTPVSPATNVHLAAARVAGFDKAAYGLPPDSVPLLFEHPAGNLLVATTKLSDFVQARHAPIDSVKSLWKGILTWLSPKARVPDLSWEPMVHASYGRDAKLPRDAQLAALRRSLAWYRNSGLFVSPQEDELVRQTGGAGLLPPASPAAPRGDGSLGLMQGHASAIRYDGLQPRSTLRRSDCVLETAMTLALGGRLFLDEPNVQTANRLADYWLFSSGALGNGRADVTHPACGLMAWGIDSEANLSPHYGDDNARATIALIANSVLCGTDRWDTPIMRCLLGNLRTTGANGFRHEALSLSQLQANGWQRYFSEDLVQPSPHYQAWLHAAFLLAYERTGYEPFLDRAKKGLAGLMERYPDGWRWTNGMSQERARMLLPLAWLINLEDTEEHRGWIMRIATDLEKLQEECGAIREEIGAIDKGQMPPPRSNAAYGRGEASLIHDNGDPVADLLYTVNFALIGLHEAAAATREAVFFRMEDRLVDFLCRAQVRSGSFPDLDGAWFRAFDYQRWEYYASDADHLWGPWCTMSGWTQSWITTVLAMREMNTCLWTLLSGSTFAKAFPETRALMLPRAAPAPAIPAPGVPQPAPPQAPEAPPAPAPAPALPGLPTQPEQPAPAEPPVDLAAQRERKPHEAVGAAATLAARPNPLHPGLGLTDGVLAAADSLDPAWSGFSGRDLEAVIDLGKECRISEIGAHFLQDRAAGVYLPRHIEFAASNDGIAWSVLAEGGHSLSVDQEGPLTRTLTARDLTASGRFVRVKAGNLGSPPAGAPHADAPAWLFVSEILVNPAAPQTQQEGQQP